VIGAHSLQSREVFNVYAAVHDRLPFSWLGCGTLHPPQRVCAISFPNPKRLGDVSRAGGVAADLALTVEPRCHKLEHFYNE
jgi:hypothetical protein